MGTLLYFVRLVETTILVALVSVDAYQAAINETTAQVITKLLYYCSLKELDVEFILSI